MPITNKQIEHLANLARLQINKSEKDKLTKQVGDILDFVSQLKEVDTTDVKPLFSQTEPGNLRVDENKTYPSQSLIEAFPRSQDRHLKTPKIF